MLTKNLAELKKIQPKLAERIEATEVTQKVTLFLGPNQDVNIAYEDIALHRMADPMGEALDIFENDIPDSHNKEEHAIAFIFGLGLGYLLRRMFVETKWKLVVYEPYLEVLRQTLEAVDFTAEIASKRVLFVTRPEEIIPTVNKQYLLGDTFITLTLPSYREKEPELFLAALNEIKSGMFANVVGQNTALKMTEGFTRSSIQNIPLFLQYPDAVLMHDSCKGKPGVVVSAGPSLDRPGVMEALKEYRDHLIIASVGQAAKALDKAGIVPDLVCIVEYQDVAHQIEGVSYLNDMNLLLLPQSHQKLFHFPTKRKMLCHAYNDPFMNWTSKALNKSLFGYNHQGTVSITTLIHLMKMGCNPIFLLGQDLAYPEGKMYASNSVYRDCKITTDEKGRRSISLANKEEFYGIFYKDEADRERKHQQMVAGLTETKGWNDEVLYTSPTYNAFQKAFEGIQYHNPEYTLVNCSEGGALIKGMEHLPFKEALEKFNVKQFHPKPQLDQVLIEGYHEEEPGSTAYQKVYEQYKQDREELEYIQQIAEEGLTEVKKLLKEASSKKTLTNSLQSRMRKLLHYDSILSQMTKTNELINCYIKQEMFKFTKEYGRKMENTDDHSDVQAGDMDALKENVKSTELLYEAVSKGAKNLMETMDPVFADFPLHPAKPQPHNDSADRSSPKDITCTAKA